MKYDIISKYKLEWVSELQQEFNEDHNLLNNIFEECEYSNKFWYSDTLSEAKKSFRDLYLMKYTIEGKIQNSHELISKLHRCYPPNVIEIRGDEVHYYHGLEEGLMCWDSIDKQELIDEINKGSK